MFNRRNILSVIAAFFATIFSRLFGAKTAPAHEDEWEVTGDSDSEAFEFATEGSNHSGSEHHLLLQKPPGVFNAVINEGEMWQRDPSGQWSKIGLVPNSIAAKKKAEEDRLIAEDEESMARI